MKNNEVVTRKEYIERDAVMQAFADHVRRSNNSDFAKTPTWNQAVQIVENAPAADVRPVIHATWETDTCHFYCSECEHYVDYKTNFCPNCGAKMDSKGGDGDV